MLNIDPIPAFNDNYIWLLSCPQTRKAFVVDPGDAAPVESVLRERGLTLDGILITHHHPDHTGGVAALREGHAPTVYGPHNPAIEGIDVRLAADDEISVLGENFSILEVPGHTLDHIAFYHRGDTPLLFCGDTLFAAGCGRIFEGTAPMMYASLQRLAALPPSTRVFCAHEYTLANLAFACAVEPDNSALTQRTEAARATRERGEPTVPSTLELELATNPFMRCAQPELISALRAQGRLQAEDPAAVFATVRSWKDSF